MKPKIVHDISVMLGKESIDYPGDTEFSRNMIMELNDSFCNLSRLEMSCHSGTHLDVPYHFFADGKKLHEFDADEFIYDAEVIEIENKSEVTAEEVDWSRVREGEAVLFKTRNSREGLVNSGSFVDDFVYLSEGAAEKIRDSGASLVGMDYISIEKYGVTEFHSHLMVLGRNIIVLEAINLSAISEGRYTLMCLPLKIHGAEASPVRAILLE